MRKITELAETRYRTVREKDVFGNKITKQVAYTAFREVHVIFGGKRFAHSFVDGMVYYVIYYFFEYTWISISALAKDPLNTLISGFFISVLFMFSFPIYYIVFEHFLQRTPGKFLTKCVVIDIYGNRPEIGTNILRNIIRLVPFEPFSCLFSERGWHDRWSDTYVVSEEEYVIIKELQLKAENEMTENTEIESVSLPTSKTMRTIFLYVILPISILLYVGIVYRGCTKTQEILNDPTILKEMQRQQESNQQ